MSEKYKVRNQDRAYFITFAVEGWADVFTGQLYRDIDIVKKKKAWLYVALVLDDKPYSLHCRQ